MAALSAVFQVLLNMSYAGGIVILVVLVLRLCLTRLPKKYRFLLWAAVFLRLICPVFPESQLSLIPPHVTQFQLEERASVSPDAFTPSVRADTAPSASPAPEAPGPAVGETSQAGIAGTPVQAPPSAPETPSAPDQSRARAFLQTDGATLLWLIGCNAVLLYMVFTYLRLRRSLATSWRAENGVWESDTIPGPFVLGIWRPRIYFPCGLDPKTREIVLLHERAHLARRDHWVKPLACLVLALHWFNPLVWLAFRLMSRDMEFACDERVLARLGADAKVDYSACLLSFAAPAPRFAGSPLAFGENSAKGRIRNVLHYKKPAFWLVLLATVVLTVALTVLLTDPLKEAAPSGLTLAQFTDDLTVEADFSLPFTLLELGEESAVPLAASGSQLLLTTCAPLPQDSPYYAGQGYLDRSTRLILCDAGNTENCTTLLESREDELFVWGRFTDGGVVLGVLCWWAQDGGGLYQYAVRCYSFTDSRDGLALRWEQTGPCSRFEVPEPVPLGGGAVVYRSSGIPEEDRQTVTLVSPGGAVSAYELPESEFAGTPVACGNRFLIQTTRLEEESFVDAALYVGAADGSITRLTPELEGSLSAVLLGERILCLSFESLPAYSSTLPAPQRLYVLDLNGAVLSALDLTEAFSGRHLSWAAAGGQTALLRDLNGGRWVLAYVDGQENVSLQTLAAPADYCSPLYAGGGRYLLWYDQLAQKPGVCSLSVTPPAPWLGQESPLDGVSDATALTRAAGLAAGDYLNRLAASYEELGEFPEMETRDVQILSAYTEGEGCAAYARVGFQSGGRTLDYFLDFHVYPDGNGGWAYTPTAAAPKTGALLTEFSGSGPDDLAQTILFAYTSSLTGSDRSPVDRLWFCTPRTYQIYAGDEVDLTLAVSYYAVPGTSYGEAKERLGSGYSQVERTAFLRVTRLDRGDYAVTATMDEQEAVRGLTIHQNSSAVVLAELWWPGRKPTLDDLNGAPEYRQEFLYSPTLSVIARLPEQEITLYNVPWLDGTVMICLRQGERFQLFAQEWGEMRASRPVPVCADWDGDGTQELAVTYHTGWGTGVSCDELHLYEPAVEGWLDVPLDNGIVVNTVTAALGLTTSPSGHDLTLTCGPDVWQLHSDEYVYSGVIFPGSILGLSAEGGRLSYTLGGGTCSDALPYAASLYVDNFTASGTISYDGTGFSVDSVALTQDIL